MSKEEKMELVFNWKIRDQNEFPFRQLLHAKASSADLILSMLLTAQHLPRALTQQEIENCPQHL